MTRHLLTRKQLLSTHVLRMGLLTLALLFIGVGTTHAAPVRGEVISSQDGQPIARAQVVFFQGQEEVARTTTADDGEFFVRDLDEGTYTVKVTQGKQEKKFPNTRIRAKNNQLRFKL